MDVAQSFSNRNEEYSDLNFNKEEAKNCISQNYGENIQISNSMDKKKLFEKKYEIKKIFGKVDLVKVETLETICHEKDGIFWFRPSSLLETHKIRKEIPESLIYYGNTDFLFRKKNFKSFIDVTRIEETMKVEFLNSDQNNLSQFHTLKEEKILSVGASVEISSICNFLKEKKNEIDETDDYSNQIFSNLINAFEKFFSNQVRNASGLGGNCLRSDLTPLLVTLDARLLVLPLNQSNLILKTIESVMSTPMNQRDLIVSIVIGWSSSKEEEKFLLSIKNGPSTDRLVSFASKIVVKKEKNNYFVKDSKIAVGLSMQNPYLYICNSASDFLKDKELNIQNIENACNIISNNCLPQTSSDNSFGGIMEFRRSFASSSFFRLYLMISDKLNLSDQLEKKSSLNVLSKRVIGGIQSFEVLEKSGIQTSLPLHGEKSNETIRYPVGLPISQLQSKSLTTGEVRLSKF